MKVVHISAPIVSRPLVIGVVADTHVTSHSAPLNADISRVLAARRVNLIFHLGDIVSRSVIHTLEKIAPVYTVRGNRDLGFTGQYPAAILMNLGEINIGLTHGHGPMPHYLWDKFHYYMTGFRFERYRRLLDGLFPTAEVRLFGHTHVAFSRWSNNVLYFNPGGACAKTKHDPHPSIGILTLDGPDHIEPEIIFLGD
jgi:putative phosphoesterase